MKPETGCGLAVLVGAVGTILGTFGFVYLLNVFWDLANGVDEWILVLWPTILVLWIVESMMLTVVYTQCAKLRTTRAVWLVGVLSSIVIVGGMAWLYWLLLDEIGMPH
nr:hypothetical protein [Kibdelosporangium sp. MJ126-NF4]CEL22694.1 hypothetical protein [Kibdelosporangium sp. MJ126-NF4]CTQ89834.1 hypothetical protein [Kibdelosporangium sp. MJ126-NF4]